MFEKRRQRKIQKQLTELILKRASQTSIIPEPPAEPNSYLQQSGKGNILDDVPKLREELRKFANSNSTFSAVLRLTSMFASKEPHILCEDEENREILDRIFPTNELEPFFADFFREYLLIGECTSVAKWDDENKCFSSEQIVNPSVVQTKEGEFYEDDEISIDVYASRDIGVEIDKEDIVRVVHKKEPWSTGGYPYFATALTSLYQIESLDSALVQQLNELAIPLLITTVGNMSDGTNIPNIVTPEQLESVADSVRTALMMKLRNIVFPAGVEIKNAFSGAQIADLNKYYETAKEGILQTVSMGKSLLDGSSGGPYASGAINRDVYTSYIETMRKAVIKAYQKRIDKAIQELDLKCYRIDEEGERRVMYIDEYGNYTFDETDKVAPEEASISFDPGMIKDTNAQLNTISTLQKMDVPISKEYIIKASGLDINLGEQLKKLEEERELRDELGQTAEDTPMNTNPYSEKEINETKTEIKSPNDKRNYQ